MFQQAQAQFQNQAHFQAREVPEVVVDPDAQFIQQVIGQIIEPIEGHAAIDIDTQDVQHRFVDAIIALDAQGQDVVDDTFNQIFDAIGDRQQQERVVRRMKFMLHPDKNTHRMAKDAF